MAPKSNSPRLPWILAGIGWIALLAYAIWLWAGRPAGLETLFDGGIYNGTILIAGTVCFAKAAAGRELRGAWISFGLGLTSWAAADTYYVVVLQDLKRIPYPSIADVGYLFTLPCLFVGIALLVKQRVGKFTLADHLDGAIGSLGFAALGTAVLAPALIGLAEGDTATVFTNMAYPIGDITLLAVVVGALTVGGVSRASPLLLIGAGLFIWSGADALYLYQLATGTYEGGAIDLLWPAGALLIGTSAALSTITATHRRRDHQSSLLVPMLATLTAVVILIRDHFDRVGDTAIWLSGLTLLAVSARLFISARENLTLVNRLRTDSVTDPLTGLGNRRQLFVDLDDALEPRRRDPHRRYLALLDLDGFKAYNDGFGHSAGDALLRRLGTALKLAADDRGSAYRLGGDEFCVLFEVDEPERVPEYVETLRDAFSERGDGFSISASCGIVEVGAEAETSAEILRTADQRMYGEKGRRSRRLENRETHDVLLNALREREPSLGPHMEGVAYLAERTSVELGLEPEEIETVSRGAELHDIGKIAIPDAILAKPGPLDHDEWELMRQHTLIGERILFAAPTLRRIGKLVRSSHERWDGAGYPDGLAGPDIPLGSRIIFACDSFEAMTSSRPYQLPKTTEEALIEIRAGSGTQFDSRVVDAFCQVIAPRTTKAGPRRGDPALESI